MLMLLIVDNLLLDWLCDLMLLWCVLLVVWCVVVCLFVEWVGFDVDLVVLFVLLLLVD